MFSAATMERVGFYTNQRLLELMSEGHEAAFMVIYDRYWQKVFSVAFNRLKKVQEAEDIVHDVFATLWANREKLQIETLENYLATAAKYLVLAKLKKQAKEQNYKRVIQLNTNDSIEYDFDQTIHYKRILQLVKTEVEKLPEKCRIIFKYSRDEGMSVKQIAEVLHISPKTVENQLGKALKQLKVALRTFLPIFILLILLFI